MTKSRKQRRMISNQNMRVCDKYGNVKDITPGKDKKAGKKIVE